MVDNLTFTDHGTQYAPHYDDTTEADQISALAPGDDRIKIDVLVSDVESDTPPQIAEKATVEDTSGTIVATVWDDADAPALICPVRSRSWKARAGGSISAAGSRLSQAERTLTVAGAQVPSRSGC